MMSDLRDALELCKMWALSLARQQIRLEELDEIMMVTEAERVELLRKIAEADEQLTTSLRMAARALDSGG